ncbi:MAG TPA: toll/interleukin-1 receptor domain-containing protein [Thermoanaerobaculia bacterium]|nr:toll/interleukin-1 receptor domain-containing protein [Thermoanaerobaculia bacterium]
MISFLSFDDLGRLSRNLSNPGQILARARKQERKTVFLSHSHKDEKYLPLIIHILENHGASVYVAVKDETLPESPSVETAAILRHALSLCRKFIVFVTTDSKDSKWIPWELGLGDGGKTPRNVAIIPAAQTHGDQAWAEREYLGLYDRVVWGNFQGKDAEWLVYGHHDNAAVRLADWLTR